jgi:hypothetical protein
MQRLGVIIAACRRSCTWYSDDDVSFALAVNGRQSVVTSPRGP